MENEEWTMQNGELRTENCKLRMENGELKMENGELRMEIGEWRMENGELRMEIGEWRTLAKWLLEFLGIPRNKGVNFHGKFGLGIPRNS